MAASPRKTARKPRPPGTRPGPNAHKRTPVKEAIVRAMVAAGEKHPVIAEAVGCAPSTLYANYDDLLNHPGGGRPAHEPTDASRAMVATHRALGLTFEEIAGLLDLADIDTLKKHYPKELEYGSAKITAQIGSKVVLRALSKDADAQRAAEFFLNSRAGWAHQSKIGPLKPQGAADEAAEATLVNGRPVTRDDARRVAFMLARAASEGPPAVQQARVVEEAEGEGRGA